MGGGGAPAGEYGTLGRRLRMYMLLNGYVMAFKVPRFMINTLVPFIVADLGLPHTTTPTLLAAFHPGYITTQVNRRRLISLQYSYPAQQPL